MINNVLYDREIGWLLEKYPFVRDFFAANGLRTENINGTLRQYIAGLNAEFLEDIGVSRDELFTRFAGFMTYMEQTGKGLAMPVQRITILGGRDKTGKPENIALDIQAGEIICILGPTGSGKSRLLADIEWMAQGDTPTGRKILINGQIPPKNWRFSIEHKLVTQISQNMNFVLDTDVFAFVQLHAESRMVDKPQERIEEVIYYANLLAGEKFASTTPLTALSGGQSRALMVADAAFLSTAPVVLIDEIENAGINRRKALELLVKKDKIVLIATHDPILALLGRRRIVLKNGSVYKITATSKAEKQHLQSLEKVDQLLLSCREMLRNGESLDGINLDSIEKIALGTAGKFR